MSNTNKERVPCSNCGGMVLSVIATKNNGLCALCAREKVWAEEDAARKAAQKTASPLELPEPLKKYPELPYEQWSKEEHKRWIDAGHTFGTHLMQYVRDQALQTLPKDSSKETKTAVAEAISKTLFSMMALLDGINLCNIGSKKTVEYALLARIKNEVGTTIEEIELAPDGDGLGMGLAGWWKNEFWK